MSDGPQPTLEKRTDVRTLTPLGVVTSGAVGRSLDRVVVLRQVIKRIKAEIAYLEMQIRTQPSDKYQGAVTALNVIRVWAEREVRNEKKQHNEKLSDSRQL